jgi:hypothetical protein
MSSRPGAAGRLRRLLQLVGLAILVYVLFSIGIHRIITVVSQAQALPMVLALVLALASWGLRLWKLRLLLKGGPNEAHYFEVFIASRTGKELSQFGYFFPLLAKRLRSGGTLAALLVDRYIETLATVVIALGCTFVVGALPWGQFFRITFIVLLGVMASAAVTPIPAPRRGPDVLLRLMAHGRSLQQTLRASLCDLGGVVGLTLLATLLDFVVVRIIFLSLGVEVRLACIPIVWAATALVSVATLTAYGPGDYSTIHLYRVLSQVPAESTAAMLILGRGLIGMASLGSFVLLGTLLTRTNGRQVVAP